MKRITIVVLAVALMGAAANFGHSQTTSTPDTQTKQDAKAQKTKAKSDKKAEQKADKKTTTQQDAAYALAHKNQAPEGHPPK